MNLSPDLNTSTCLRWGCSMTWPTLLFHSADAVSARNIVHCNMYKHTVCLVATVALTFLNLDFHIWTFCIVVFLYFCLCYLLLLISTTFSWFLCLCTDDGRRYYVLGSSIHPSSFIGTWYLSNTLEELIHIHHNLDSRMNWLYFWWSKIKFTVTS